MARCCPGQRRDTVVLTEQRPVAVAVGSASRVGGRDHNEDAVLAKPIGATGNAWLLAVADGMGGHAGGEVASRLAIDAIGARFSDTLPADVALELKRLSRGQRARLGGGRSGQHRPHGHDTRCRGSQRRLPHRRQRRRQPGVPRARQPGAPGHPGSLARRRAGREGGDPAGTERQSPQRNVLTAAIGTTERLDRKLPDIYELTLLPEDRLLLCSDGFYDVIEQREYAAQLTGDNPETLSMALTSLAEQRGTTDNVSAVVLVAKPSRATEQRRQLETAIAEQKPQGSPVLIFVVIVVVVLAIAAAGFYYFFW